MWRKLPGWMPILEAAIGLVKAEILDSSLSIRDVDMRLVNREP